LAGRECSVIPGVIPRRMDDLWRFAGHSDIHPPDQVSCFTWNASDPLGQTGGALPECWFSRAPPQPGEPALGNVPTVSPLSGKTGDSQQADLPDTVRDGKGNRIGPNQFRSGAPPEKGTCLKVLLLGWRSAAETSMGPLLPWSLTDGPTGRGDCSGPCDINQSLESGFGQDPLGLTINPGMRVGPPIGEPHPPTRYRP